MRFLFCKSIICFCKSSSHIYCPGSLKLENPHHVPATAAVVSAEKIEVEDEDEDEEEQQSDANEVVKSCLKKEKKKTPLEVKETRKKKRVQWMDTDSSGKGLVEIREFERSEAEVMNNQGDGSHDCIIL